MSVFEKKGELVQKLIIFFIWPFGSFLISLKEFRKNSSLVIFFLFFILYGFTFVVEFERVDSFRYVQQFENISSASHYDLRMTLSTLFQDNNKTADIYFYLISFFVSRFTTNYHYLFAVFSIIFSYFYISSFKLLVTDEQWRTNQFNIVFAIVFVLSNPIFNINGMRFWTAAWVCVYAMLQVLTRNNYKFLLLLLLCPLIHFSYISMLVIIPFFFLIKRFDSLLIVAYFGSFFLGAIIFQVLAGLTDILPGTFVNKIEWYSSDYMQEKLLQAGLPTYAKILKSLMFYYVNLLIMHIILFERRKINESIDKRLFLFILFLMCFVNLTISVPSFGRRYFALVIPIFMYLMMRFEYSNSFRVVRFAFLLPIVAAYGYLDLIRLTILTGDPYLYLSTFLHIIVRNI